ncbi:hypothetical protein RAM80_00085 [Pseudomonas sp. App30]|uniref:hypothetical protein n=1 Tax=Pseudomonas sp. App30 TaxID=3068990 RepID=UPI003A8133C9
MTANPTSPLVAYVNQTFYKPSLGTFADCQVLAGRLAFGDMVEIINGAQPTPAQCTGISVSQVPGLWPVPECERSQSVLLGFKDLPQRDIEDGFYITSPGADVLRSTFQGAISNLSALPLANGFTPQCNLHGNSVTVRLTFAAGTGPILPGETLAGVTLQLVRPAYAALDETYYLSNANEVVASVKVTDL